MQDLERAYWRQHVSRREKFEAVFPNSLVPMLRVHHDPQRSVVGSRGGSGGLRSGFGRGLIGGLFQRGDWKNPSSDVAWICPRHGPMSTLDGQFSTTESRIALKTERSVESLTGRRNRSKSEGCRTLEILQHALWVAMLAMLFCDRVETGAYEEKANPRVNRKRNPTAGDRSTIHSTSDRLWFWSD